MAASTKLVLVMIALLMGVSILFYGVMFDREGSLQLAHDAVPSESAVDADTAAPVAGEPPAAAPARPSLAAAATTVAPEPAAPAPRPALGAAPGAAARPALGAASAAPRPNLGQIEMGAARGPLAGGTRIPAPLLNPDLSVAEEPKTAPTGTPAVAAAASAVMARPESAVPTPSATPATPAPSADTAPAPAPAPAAPAAEPRPRPRPSEILVSRYSVRPGDTLSGIAAAQYGHARHWRAIVEANPGLDPKSLQPGQPILLPPRATVLGGTPASSPAPKASPAPSPALAAGERMHEVASGETLSSIAADLLGAARHWRLIAERNEDLLGGDPDRLRVGMRLRIPARPAD